MSYEPIITPGRNFFLVSTEYKESCSAWCRKQIRVTLRTCQASTRTWRLNMTD